VEIIKTRDRGRRSQNEWPGGHGRCQRKHKLEESKNKGEFWFVIQTQKLMTGGGGLKDSLFSSQHHIDVLGGGVRGGVASIRSGTLDNG